MEKLKNWFNRLLSPKPKSLTTLTDGKPVPEDRSHTKLKPNGQQEGYIVLSEEERAKGFVRPVRRSYKHVGATPRYPLRDLTPEEHERYDKFGYVKFEAYPEEQEAVTGRFWTQETLNAKGCGTVTTMAQSIAETYARTPRFYGATFCCGCGTHLRTDQFVWIDDGTEVGS